MDFSVKSPGYVEITLNILLCIIKCHDYFWLYVNLLLSIFESFIFVYREINIVTINF